MTDQQIVNQTPSQDSPQKHLPMQLIMLFNAALLVIVIFVGGIISYQDIQSGRKISSDNLLQAENTANLLAGLVEKHLPLKKHLNKIKILVIEYRNYLDFPLLGNSLEIPKLEATFSDMITELGHLKNAWQSDLSGELISKLEQHVEKSGKILREMEENPTGDDVTYLVAESLSLSELINIKADEIERYLDEYSENTVHSILVSNRRTTTNAGVLSDLIESLERRYFITLLIIIVIVTIFQVVFFIILKERLGSLIQIARRISSSGNLSERVNWISKDEIGTLVQTFNQMLDRLENTQNELSANETYLDDIFHSMLNALIVINPDKSIRTVNHSLLALLEYQEDQLIGQPIDLIFPNHPEHLCPKQYIETTDQSYIIHGEEHIFIAKSGAEVPVLVSCSIIRDLTRKNRGVVCVAQNVSQLKQMEVDRKKLEDQLRQSQKMEAIGTLAGGIAHDFNNILSTMQGFTWLLLADKAEDSEERDYLNEIYKAGERAAELIQQILTFSRSDNQDKKPLKLSPLVKEALRFLRATIPKSIEIRQVIQPDCQSVLANATQIHQIIINLCTNALHAMKDQQGMLTVSLDQVDGNDEHELKQEYPEASFVRITVSDTGHGIKQEIKNRIFEPFFTTKEVGEGTGLGLSVVHGIVKNHGGRIFLNTAEGKGTTFEIYLPVIDSLSQEEIEEEIYVPVKGNEHILIVEDEPSLSRFYEIALSQLGYRVTRERNAYDALERFKHEGDTIDVVFTDQAMPGMTGIQMCEELLRLDPDLPVVLATGYKGDNLRDQAKAIGIRYFLEKPVKIGTVTQMIREIFDSALVDEDALSNIETAEAQSKKAQLDNAEDVIYKNDEFRDIIPLFLEERQKEVALVLDAVDKADYEEIYSLGHKMQGASEAFGFTTVSKIGLALKQSAMKGENELIQNRITELKRYLDQLENDYKI